MVEDVASKVRRRNKQASANAVHDAVTAALRDALRDLIADRGDAYLDVFLSRRLDIATNLRTPRLNEPAPLTIARMRNADAIEAALHAIVSAVRSAETTS